MRMPRERSYPIARVCFIIPDPEEKRNSRLQGVFEAERAPSINPNSEGLTPAGNLT
jgi:hypothetical protein